jgi:antitoxin PrlF
MIRSKITSKGRTTIPAPIREALGVRAGDELAYRIGHDTVVISKVGRRRTDNPFAAFGEWNSENDRRAYVDI